MACPRMGMAVPNIDAAFKTYMDQSAKISGGQFIQGLMPFILDSQDQRAAASLARGEMPGAGLFGAPPAANSGAPAAAGGPRIVTPAGAPPQPRLSSAGADSQGSQTINSLASEVFGERDVTNMLPRFAAAVGLTPEEFKASAPLTPQQEQTARAYMQRTAAATRGAPSEDVSQPTGATSAAEQGANGPSGASEQGAGSPNGASAAPFMAGGASGAPAPQAGAPPAPVGQNAPGLRPTPVGTQEEARRLFERAKNQEAAAAYLAKRNPKGAEVFLAQAKADREHGEKILGSLGEYNKPTGTQQDLPYSGAIAAAAAAKKSAETVAAAKAENVATRIKGIKPARDAIQVVDEMGDALARGANNISTGPGARQWLEVKKAVNNVFPGTFAHVSEAETIDKLNAQLAAAAAKALTQRPSQLEFRAFMQQNPGLLTSRETSKNLLDLMRQGKQQELDLGQIAARLKPGESYEDAEDKYFRTHPIISPFTHKPVDARKAPDGKYYRPNPDQPDPSKPHHWMREPG